MFIVFAILGPTSIEFTSELHDFLTNDVSRWYPELADKSSVILVEAGKHLLGTFDESLSTYVEKLFEKRKVKFLTNAAVAKGQLISKCHYEKSVSSKIPTKTFLDF